MALLSLQSSFLHPFASFPSNVVQQGTFLPRGGSTIRKPGSTRCPESRSGENGFWAGGGPRKVLSRESGSRSYPGWLPILKEGAATSSGSSSAAPPDALTHSKSARESRGMRNIRACLLETVEEQWLAEVIHGPMPSTASSAANPARSF